MQIFCDGGSRGNPGLSCIGYWFKQSGKVIYYTSECIGKQTNNYAEFESILSALKKAKELGKKQVNLYTDSKLAVESLNNNYKLKNEVLVRKKQEILELSKSFQCCYFWHIPREDNKISDFLVNIGFLKYI